MKATASLPLAFLTLLCNPTQSHNQLVTAFSVPVFQRTPKYSLQRHSKVQVRPSCIHIHTHTPTLTRALTRTFATNGNDDKGSKSTGYSKFLILSKESEKLKGDSKVEELKEKNENTTSEVLKAFFDFCEETLMDIPLKIILEFFWVNFSTEYSDNPDTQNLKKDLEEIVDPADIAKLLHEKVLMDDNVKGEVFGRSLNINSDYNDRCTQFYARPEISLGGKEKTVSLVMGASGSGKSFFAAKKFPQEYFAAIGKTEADDKPDYYVTVFMTYNAIGDKGQNKTTIENNVRQYVKTCFRKELGSRYDPTEPVENLFLCVVIDEVVGETCEFFMDTDLKFPKEIASDLKTKVASSEVHVVLAGTGLEKLSKGIDTTVPCTKIRMRDWNIETFRKYCEPMHPNPADIVQRHPALLSLVSNARCAYFLKNATRDLRIWNETNDNMGFVNAVLQYVAAKYKSQNGLRDVVNETKLQLIAKGVLMVLRKATEMKKRNDELESDGGDPTWDFIEYDETIPTEDHYACDGFLDVNLEKTGKKVGLADPNKKYPVGISNALIYLIAVFMGDSGHVGADPQRFEYLTALGEAQMKLIKLKKEELHLLPIKIVASPVQCPGKKSDKINFLNTSTSNVVINAGLANFADVYCKLDDGQLRVVQAKFSIDGVQVNLNLSAELSKNGMLESSSVKQTKFLNYLYRNWTATSSDFRNIETESTMEEGTGTEEEIRRSTYPASKMVVYPKNKLSGLYTTEEVELASLDDHDGDEKFKITAVFSTNAGKFHITGLVEGKKSSMDITKDDVDINGQLMEGKRIELLNFVKQNGIDLRRDLNLEFEFSFYSCN